MSYFIWLILMSLAAIAAWFVVRVAKVKLEKLRSEQASDDDMWVPRKTVLWGRITYVALAIGIVLLTAFSSVYKVGSRDVGVITFGGKIVGQTGHGWQLIPPWYDVEVQSIAVLKYKIGPPDGEKCNVDTGLTTFSSETQPVYICATLNWHVDADKVQHLYQTVGPNFQDVILPSRFNQAFKDETVKFKTVKIAPSRETIRKDVLAHLKITLGKYSISADDLNIDDIEFSQQFQNAIDDKQVATQEALAAQNRVAKAQYEADQLAAKADGEARATLINARAQAKANHLLARSISPTLVMYQYVQKIAEGIKTIVVPAGSNTILPTGGLGSLTGK